MKKIIILLGVTYLSSGMAAEPIKTKTKDADKYEGPEMTVFSTAKTTDRKFPDTAKATPTYTIDKTDIDAKVNATTVEDTLRYSPSLHMRKRYIGDQNAMMGIRGTNVLQTTHNRFSATACPCIIPSTRVLRVSPDGP